MKPELQKKLFEKYPEIFVQKDLSPQETCMCWGIDCGDGWYLLIDGLCQSIQNHVVSKTKNAKFQKKEGRFPPNEEADYKVEAVQVKEKFGGLRFYTGGHDDVVEGMIELAEILSFQICEQCGEEGKRRGVGWIFTLCDKCDNKRLGEGK